MRFHDLNIWLHAWLLIATKPPLIMLCGSWASGPVAGLPARVSVFV